METIYISLDDIIFLSALSIFLIIIYRRIVKDWNFIEKIGQKYSESERKDKVQNRIKYINRQPTDKQKIIFKDLSMLAVAILIIIVIGTRSIFFADVVSQSMVPTFDKNDLVLMQNIDRTYNIGDIIMFSRPDTSLPVSHRIISISEDGIQTAGDATKNTDWWKLKNEDILGKAVSIRGNPLVIKGYGVFFTVEDRNQKFGPFDYQTYLLFINVLKAYGYAIAIISLLIYIALTLNGSGRKDKIMKY